MRGAEPNLVADARPGPAWTTSPSAFHRGVRKRAVELHRGVAWDTCWSAIKPHAETLIKVPGRVRGVKTIGVDEHIWRTPRVSSTDRAVTVMVALTRDADGNFADLDLRTERVLARVLI